MHSINVRWHFTWAYSVICKVMRPVSICSNEERCPYRSLFHLPCGTNVKQCGSPYHQHAHRTCCKYTIYGIASGQYVWYDQEYRLQMFKYLKNELSEECEGTSCGRDIFWNQHANWPALARTLSRGDSESLQGSRDEEVEHHAGRMDRAAASRPPAWAAPKSSRGET